MKKKVITWIIIVVVVGGLIGLRVSAKNKKSFVSVKTETVQQGEIKSFLSTTATIKSKNSKDYYPLQGKIEKVNVKVGDVVKKGQVLVEYEVQDMNAAVKQTQIQYDNAVLAKQIRMNQTNKANDEIKNNIAKSEKKIADYNKQIADLDVKIAEAQKNPLAGQVIETLQSQKSALQQQMNVEKEKKDSLKTNSISKEEIKQLDNAISLAKLALDNAKQNLSKSQDKITADIDGVVTAVNAVEGATSMASAQPAVTVQDVENLKAVMSVGKYDANKVEVGQEAIIKSGASEYKGKVSFIDPAAKKTVSATGTETTLGVEIDILDKAEDLKIDFDADVDILLGQVTNAVKVPAESIRTTKEDKTFVYIVEGDKVVEKEVKLGLQSDMEAQVVEGVKANDKVILNPSENIKSGTVVKEASGDGE